MDLPGTEAANRKQYNEAGGPVRNAGRRESLPGRGRSASIRRRHAILDSPNGPLVLYNSEFLHEINRQIYENVFQNSPSISTN